MDKETLSNYGWIVICVLVLAVMIALASPFGSYVASAVENTTQGLFDVQQGALSAAGIDIADQSFDDASGGESSSDAPLILEVGATVPSNTTYYVVDETAEPVVILTIDGTDIEIPARIYGAGQTIPQIEETEQHLYITNDYFYSYNPDNDGWHLTVSSDYNKTEYGAIYENINGKPVTDMSNAFSSCINLTTAPTIPSSVTIMNNTFWGCTKLTTAPVIPNGVTAMGYTFNGCTSLTTAPVIPSSVTYMDHTFSGCTSLKTYAGSTDADGDFSNYVIPNGINIMEGAFEYCASLTVAPVIPSSVTYKDRIFFGCTSLTGN